MDLHKLVHEACEVSRHWHLPLLAGFASSIKFRSKMKAEDLYSDLGDVPGDNILPKAILNSLISRRSL